MILEYASKVVPRSGEVYCGDAVFVRIEAGQALFALLDGLGHGEGASRVAQRGLALLGDLPVGVDAVTALHALNASLHGTRGAAATICSFRGADAEIAGVGNVSCRAIGARCSFVPTPGVLGFCRETHNVMRVTLAVGHRLVLHSDGISHGFASRPLLQMTPAAACEFIVRSHRHPHDDASVLIIANKTRS